MTQAELTPRQIVEALDKYIVGQLKAKKAVAVALRNRWRRKRVEGPLKDEILPNNIILIGTTGVGKTEIARRVARLYDAPFLKVEASKYTEVGYVGRDVESMIRDLVDLSVNMVKQEKTREVHNKATKNAGERVLDLLLPGTAGDTEDDGDRSSTRKKIREKLNAGALENRKVEIDVTAESNPMMQIFSPMGIEEMGINLGELFGSQSGKKKKKRKMTVAEARAFLVQEESAKLIDMEEVVKIALRRAEESGIIFLDEIDKIADGREKRNSPDISREGVQRDLLPVIEGSNVVTKYGMLRTDHILFIAAGAFHVSKPSDLIPELQGRFPIRVELDSLTEGDFCRILTEPDNALVKQYCALLKTEEVDITFEPVAIKEIARLAFELNQKTENIGARRLHTVMNALLETTLFDLPDRKIRKVRITKRFVRERLGNLVQDEDLSRHIL